MKRSGSSEAYGARLFFKKGLRSAEGDKVWLWAWVKGKPQAPGARARQTPGIGWGMGGRAGSPVTHFNTWFVW